MNELKNEQRETAFVQVDSIWRKVSNLPKIIWVAVFVTALTTGLLTGGIVTFVHLNYGYPVGKMFGAVSSNTQGGFAEHRELEELRGAAIENLALDVEAGKKIRELRRKLGYKNETEEVLRGILKDDPGFLESAKTKNADRDGLFDFINWKSPDDYVSMMMERNAYKCIQWVISQPNWYSCLNEQVYFKVLEFSEREQMTNEKMWANLKKARVKKQMLLGWWHDDKTYIDNSNPKREVVDVNSLSDAWLSEFLKNCQRDGRTNILNYLQLNMEKNKIVPSQNAAE